MDNFISRWKLNRENLLAICKVLAISDEVVSTILEKCEQGIISDFIANRAVEIIELRLDEDETPIKALALKLISRYCVQITETDAVGRPYMTPKILGIDRLYKDENGIMKIGVGRSRWLLFYYLFDLDKEQSTLVDKLDADKRAEF